jgi:hypothetical protein
MQQCVWMDVVEVEEVDDWLARLLALLVPRTEVSVRAQVRE